MPDHIHLFIKCTPNHRVSDIVRHLKGYSSYKLRSEYPKYRKQYKWLCAPSYYCESVGHISEHTVKKYIDDQWLVAKRMESIFKVICAIHPVTKVTGFLAKLSS